MGKIGSIHYGLIVGFIFSLGACQASRSPSSHSSDSLSKNRPHLVMEPMRMATYGRNGKEWELKAKSAHGYSNHNLIFLDQMKVVTYDRGREATTIEAQEGIFNRKLGIPYKPGEGDFLTGIPKLMEGDLFMQNGVVIVSTDGTKLMTDWMHFHNKDDLVTSTAPVKIIRDDSITEGTGMKAKPDLSKVEIYNETLIIKGDE